MIMGFLGFKSRAEKDAICAAAEEQRLDAQVKENGAAIFQALSAAAEGNKVANCQRGTLTKKERSVEGLSLLKIEKSDTVRLTFSIFVGMDTNMSPLSWFPERRGFPVFRVIIDGRKQGKEIYLFSEPNGDDIKTDFPLAEANRAKEIASEYVRTYRKYPPS